MLTCMNWIPCAGRLRKIATRRSDRSYGRPLSAAAYTMLNIVVVRPMPTASATTASALSPGRLRSEEHTSELQSPDHLVCRLLLEKKTTDKQQQHPSSQHKA